MSKNNKKPTPNDKKKKDPKKSSNAAASISDKDDDEGPELHPITYTKKLPHTYMTKSKAIAQYAKKMANTKTNASGNGNNHNENVTDDTFGTLSPRMYPNKFTDEDIARSKSESKGRAKVRVGISIARSRTNSTVDKKIDDKKHPFIQKVQPEPELIPLTYLVENPQKTTSKFSIDDMGKAKVQAITGRNAKMMDDQCGHNSGYGKSKYTKDGGIAKVKAASSTSLGTKTVKFDRFPGRNDPPPSTLVEEEAKIEELTEYDDRSNHGLDLVSVDELFVDEPLLPVPSRSNGLSEKRQHIAESNMRSRQRRMMRYKREDSSTQEDLVNEIDHNQVGDTDDTADTATNAPNVGENDATLPGAVAVTGIGGGLGTNVWSSGIVVFNPDEGDVESIHNQGMETTHPSVIEGGNLEIPDNLIKATLVDDDAIPEAEAVSEEALIRNRRRNRLCCVAGLIVIVIAIILASILPRILSNESTKKSPTIAPTQSASPTMQPSSLPSISPTINFQSQLEGLHQGLVGAFNNTSSPQYKALQWIEDNSISGIYSFEFDRSVQRFALATLYYSLDGDNWVNSNKWLTLEHECYWFLSHQTTSSDPYPYSTLRDTRCRDGDYYSNLKLNFNRMRGELPPEIFFLSQLTLLDLSNNAIKGSIPSEVGLMTSLNVINLKGNTFEGAIPSQLGLLSSLSKMDLSSNALQYKVPSTLGQLFNLEELDVSNNALEGEICSGIGMLSKATSLSLADNTLSGTIPSNFQSLQNLEVLTISNNLLSGSVGHMLALPKIRQFSIGSNFFNGTIPSSIGNLSEVEWLDLSNNRLSGTLPSDIGLLSTLEILSLKLNDLSGTIPSDLGLLVELDTLHLESNAFRGTIPSELGLLFELDKMFLTANRLSGAIPSEFGLLVELTSLVLSDNSLSGAIPSELGLHVKLDTFHLEYNKISGAIPSELGLLINLDILHLKLNKLNGTIPSELGLLVHLDTLNLDDNSLSGTIPSELGLLVKLGFLSLLNNQLSGSVPSDLCELRKINDIYAFPIDCDKISCDCCFDRCKLPPRIINATTALNCSDGTTLLQVAVGTDRNPQGVEWNVVDESSNETLLQGGPLSEDDKHRTIMEEACIPNDACLVFTVNGSNVEGYDGGMYPFDYDAGDRFMVHWNGSEISNGRFQDFQNDEARSRKNGFAFGGTSPTTSSPITTTNACAVVEERQNSCTVTHPRCDSSGFECSLDNVGGVSGFCRAISSSVAPSMSQMPSTSPSTQAPSTSQSPTSTPCEAGLSLFALELTTDIYPEETSWELIDDITGDVMEQGGNYTEYFTLYVTQKCIPSDTCLRFTIFDSYRDGLYDVGGYTIYWNNEKVASLVGEVGSFGRFQTVGGLGSGCATSDTIAAPTVAPTNESQLPTTFPSLTPSSTLMPCQDGMVNITIGISIENDPQRTSWTLINTNSNNDTSQEGRASDNITLLEGGPYSETTTFTHSTCVASDYCLILEMNDPSSGATSDLTVLAKVDLYVDGVGAGMGIFLGVSEPGQFILYWNDTHIASASDGFMGKSQIGRIGEACPDTEAHSLTSKKSGMSSFAPSLLPTSSINPLEFPSRQDDVVNITVEISIENDPQRTAWTLVNTNSINDASQGIEQGGGGEESSTLLEGGPYTETTTFVQSTCVASYDCLVLKMKDPISQDVGKSPTKLTLLTTTNMYIDGVRVSTGIFLGPPSTLSFGNCSPIQ